MIPKPKRIVDPAAVKAARRPYCEHCHKRTGGGPHHIITVGSGGPDHALNLLQLCGDCHTKAHSGQISKDKLWQIIGKREGIEDAEERVMQMKV